MKILATSIIFLLSLPGYSFANLADTTVSGIKISINYSQDIFPVEWQIPSINAKGEQIDNAEIDRSKAIIVKALGKYPDVFLETNLKTVYFLKSLTFYDNIRFGGTNSLDAVYIANNGTIMGYTNSFIEQSFHHEFSSILFRNYPGLLDTTEWKKANVPGFDYNDPEKGVGAIRNNKSSQQLDTIFCKNGFLTEYALSGMENDVNTLAQNLFKPENDFWSKVETYPRIRKKVSLLINFYHNLSSIFSEQYFRKFQD